MASNASYYSLDALLSETQKLPCSFNLDVPNMGHLEGTTERDLHANVPLDLPFWLAAPIATMPNHDFLTLNIPRAFASRVRHALAASAKSVSLKTLAAGGGGWYEGGRALDNVIDDPSLRPTLHTTLRSRLPEIMDLSSRPPPSSSTTSAAAGASEDGGDFVQGLDEWEREMLRVGRETAGKMRGWSTGKGEWQRR